MGRIQIDHRLVFLNIALFFVHSSTRGGEPFRGNGSPDAAFLGSHAGEADASGRTPEEDVCDGTDSVAACSGSCRASCGGIRIRVQYL